MPTSLNKSSAAFAKDMSPITERFHKNDILNEISANTDLSKVDVSAVLDELATLIERHIIDGAVGEFILAGLFKVTTTQKAAKEPRVGVNPFTGQSIQFSAKPSRTSVKIHALKGLKDMAL